MGPRMTGRTPQNLNTRAASTTGTAPFTKTVVINSSNTLSALSPQTIGGATYVFGSWSDGGAQSHNVLAPAIDTTSPSASQKKIPPSRSATRRSIIAIASASVLAPGSFDSVRKSLVH